MVTCKGVALVFVYMTCTEPAKPPADTFCKIYKPIQFEASTPLKTRQRIIIANRKYARCRGQS